MKFSAHDIESLGAKFQSSTTAEDHATSWSTLPVRHPRTDHLSSPSLPPPNRGENDGVQNSAKEQIAGRYHIDIMSLREADNLAWDLLTQALTSYVKRSFQSLSHHDVNDIVQLTILKAWKKRNEVEHVGKFFTMARYEALELLKEFHATSLFLKGELQPNSLDDRQKETRSSPEALRILEDEVAARGQEVMQHRLAQALSKISDTQVVAVLQNIGHLWIGSIF